MWRSLLPLLWYSKELGKPTQAKGYDWKHQTPTSDPAKAVHTWRVCAVVVADPGAIADSWSPSPTHGALHVLLSCLQSWESRRIATGW